MDDWVDRQPERNDPARAAGRQPRTIPNVTECRFCVITDTDCPERLEGTHETPETSTYDFWAGRQCAIISSSQLVAKRASAI